MPLDWASAMPKMLVIQLPVWTAVSMLHCHGNVNMYSSQKQKEFTPGLVCDSSHTVPQAPPFSLRLQRASHPPTSGRPIQRRSLLGLYPGPVHTVELSLLLIAASSQSCLMCSFDVSVT